LRRRDFIAAGIGGAAAVTLGAAFWDDLFGAAEEGLRPGLGYGPLRAPNAEGIRLPEGFTSRVIARGRQRVEGTDYEWHLASDGAAAFPTPDGGFILVSNSEVDEGGASAIRFSADGEVSDAYRILEGTTQNCSGGGTPWGTWLSCEEVESGRVWECDPTGEERAVPRPAMGVFTHEAAAVDPRGRRVYMTEDLPDGGFYRFTPRRWPDLSDGVLEIARLQRGGRIGWVPVPDPSASARPTRRQVPGAIRLNEAEGIWRDVETVYVATTGDHRVHAYDLRRERMTVIYDGRRSRRRPLLAPDQLTGSRAGEVFVCEDLRRRSLDIAVIDRQRRVSRFLSVTGGRHTGSELTGVCFDPSGSRLFFASQRAGDRLLGPGEVGPGAVYEVAGRFRKSRA
jgi:uncharacterized protein